LKADIAVAVATLNEITENGAFANIALRKALAGEGLTPQARAFITEMVNETLRNLILIDRIIDEFSTTPTSALKPLIRNVLRIAVCQIRFLEKIPERAAVDEAVKLTKQHNFERLSGFVNGILRNIAREPERPAFSQKDVAMRFSYPPWLVNSLVKWLGGKAALEFCENSHKPAAITILVNPLKTDVASLTQSLETEGVQVTVLPSSEAESLQEPNRLRDVADDHQDASAALPSAGLLELHRTGDITRLEAFKNGDFIVIDPGALAAIRALDPKPGQTIIDLCAAPGGKAFATAFAMENTGRILAFDIHAHKIKLITQTQKRLGLSIIETSVHDALTINHAIKNPDALADAVLLDAPCSGLGTIRRHPEIKYTRTPEDIAQLAQKQAVMLANAAHYVKPGGKLVYCTCTVAQDENVAICDKFILSHPDYTLDNSVQTLPSATSDGFFTATFLRKK